MGNSQWEREWNGLHNWESRAHRLHEVIGTQPAKSPGISGSLQKWRVISRSPGMLKKSPGIAGILLLNNFCGRNANFCRI